MHYFVSRLGSKSDVLENRLQQDGLITQHQPYFVCNITDDELPHVSELLKFEADTFGEPEKYDALDEDLQ